MLNLQSTDHCNHCKGLVIRSPSRSSNEYFFNKELDMLPEGIPYANLMNLFFIKNVEPTGQLKHKFELLNCHRAV